MGLSQNQLIVRRQSDRAVYAHGFGPGVCRASHVKPQKNHRSGDFFTPQTPFVPEVRAAPIIGIFALLAAQKSTSATGCQALTVFEVFGLPAFNRGLTSGKTA
jgi:hypothetical protein